MQLKFICPLWGSENIDFKLFLEKAKLAGYHGVEFSLPTNTSEKNKVIDLIEMYDMLYIAQHWETQNSNFQEHKTAYKLKLEYLASAQPHFINAQTGKDYFSFEQNAELIELANAISKSTGIKIIHETHRGRFSFAAHVTKKYLHKLPDLKITLDLSHWFTVAESYLEDQTEALELAISRTDHIHARVGFPQGPQIPDPRANEWNDALEIHTNWWQKVVKLHNKKGTDILTITPEFGPYPYMQILPHTKDPIANQWDINAYMVSYLKKHLNYN